MAYRSLGIGCKGYIIEQSPLDRQFVYICRHCRAATGSAQSAKLNSGLLKNETEERESERLARRRGMSKGQNHSGRQDSVSRHYLQHAAVAPELKTLSAQTCRMFFAPPFISKKYNRTDDDHYLISICEKERMMSPF